MKEKRAKKKEIKEVKEKPNLIFLFIRYLILIILGINLWLFYDILAPITIYPVFFILKQFFVVSLSQNLLLVEVFPIQIINACIAGSAYFLLLILNLSTPMSIKKRIYSIIFALGLFLIINILRISLFSILVIKSPLLFTALHLIFWYALSAIIVLLIWILTIKIFRIEEIPIYTDIKRLYKLIKAR